MSEQIFYLTEFVKDCRFYYQLGTPISDYKAHIEVIEPRDACKELDYIFELDTPREINKYIKENNLVRAWKRFIAKAVKIELEAGSK